MAGHFLTPEQAESIDQMLKWWQRTKGGMPPQTKTVLGGPVPFQFGKADEVIAADGSGDFRIWEGNHSTSTYDEQEGSTIREECHDFLGTPASSGDPAFIFRHQQSGKLYYLGMGFGRIKGKVKNAFTSTSTSFDIDGVSSLGGRDPVNSTVSTVSISNPNEWHGIDNGDCHAEWIASSSQWEPYKVDHYGRVRGKTTTAVDSTDGNFNLDGVVVIEGILPTSSTSATLTVDNTHDFSMPDNGVARAEWVSKASQWEGYQGDCT